MTSISSRPRVARIAPAFVSVACFGCAGPSEPAPRAPAAYVKIDDMEGTSGRIAWTPEIPAAGALPGHWVSYSDVQCERLSPVPEWAPGGGMWTYSGLPEPFETFSGVVSEHAARLRTVAPLDNTWGAGMGFQFAEPPLGTDPTRVTRPCTNGTAPDLDYPAAPVDLSEYSGLVFWGMAAKEAGATTVLVQFQDANTDPRAGICDPVPASPGACYNGFGVVLELGETLERYELAFSELEQNPLWGYHPEPSIFEREHVYWLVFQIDTPGGVCQPPNVCLGGPPKLTFDVWIDDLYFVKR
jgi:hypothetical protein